MKGLLIDTETGDLSITQGKLQVGESQEQNANLIVLAEKGEFKEYPQLGVGVRRYIKSTGRAREMLRDIKLQLELDGINNPTIEYADGMLKIEI